MPSRKSFAVGCLLLFAGNACTAILDFEKAQSECWCGERWTTQVSGATSFGLAGESWPISASETTYTTCVSQLEHLALDTADPQDPLYVALRESLENAAIAKCETAGAELGGALFSHSNCATTGTEPVATNLLHAGACWKSEDFDDDKYCPFFPECEPYYDCSSEPIWSGGDDEAGSEIQWICGPR
jgi:hypothetical protein